MFSDAIAVSPGLARSLLLECDFVAGGLEASHLHIV